MEKIVFSREKKIFESRKQIKTVIFKIPQPTKLLLPVCGSKFFMGGARWNKKKIYLAKFQNFYYINSKKMGGGHRPPSSAPPGCYLKIPISIQFSY